MIINALYLKIVKIWKFIDFTRWILGIDQAIGELDDKECPEFQNN